MNAKNKYLLILFFTIIIVAILAYHFLKNEASFQPINEFDSKKIVTIATTSLQAETQVVSPTTTIIGNHISENDISSQVSPPVVVRNVAVGGNNYGLAVSTTLYKLSDKQLSDELDDIASLGIGWLRIDFSWESVQPGSATGTYHWESIDRVVEAANLRNLKILPILVDTPVWARSSACKDTAKCEPHYPEDFALFAQNATARYAPRGIHSWEIWNEPNVPQFWSPKPSPEEYTKLLKATYVAIKNQDSNAVIITGGLAPSETRDGKIAPIDFLTQIYQQGGRAYFDAVGLHPYAFPSLPSTFHSWSSWSQMVDTKTSIRSIMQLYGDNAKQVWLTEVGAPTDGPGNVALDSNGKIKSDHVSEELQSKILTDVYVQYKKYNWAGPIFWYNYKDDGYSKETSENFFGLLRYDGSRKPAYEQLKISIKQKTSQ